MIPSRFELCCLPTPCHRLPRASARLGVDLWIKRDDLTGFAGGGNKGRKLEYLVPEIQASGAEVVVTCGSTQSNFVRQLAAACRMICPCTPAPLARTARPRFFWKRQGWSKAAAKPKGS